MENDVQKPGCGCYMAPCFWDIVTSKPSQQTKVGNAHKHIRTYISFYIKKPLCILIPPISIQHYSVRFSFSLSIFPNSLLHSKKYISHVLFLLSEVTHEYQLPHYKGTLHLNHILDIPQRKSLFYYTVLLDHFLEKYIIFLLFH